MAPSPQVVIVDCFDSFTNLLGDLVYRAGGIPNIREYTASSLLHSLPPFTHLILGPGPGSPEHYPAILEVVRNIRKPTLGVCLGHQIAAVAFGGSVRQASEPQHGKHSLIMLQKASLLFRGCPAQFTVGRYHSLVVEAQDLPSCLEITAVSEDNEIQALQHTAIPYYGVQFHPESFLTDYGLDIMKNFLYGEFV
jgi:anthranilate synthase component 2